jgi:putative endonuclease
MNQWIEKWFGRSAEAAHLKAGKWGEQQAVRFLKARKFKIRGQRVRAGRHDEIDIVAGHNGVTVFIEVKMRKNELYGRPFSAVNKAKRKRLSRAAVAYLKHNKLKPDHIRFDVVEVIGEPGHKTPEIRHIENAFPLDNAYRLWW